MRGHIHLLTSTPQKGTSNISIRRKQGRNQNEFTRRKRNRKEKEEKETEKWPLDFDGHRDFFPSPDRRRSPAPWFRLHPEHEKGVYFFLIWVRALGLRVSLREIWERFKKASEAFIISLRVKLAISHRCQTLDRFQSRGGWTQRLFLAFYFGILAHTPFPFSELSISVNGPIYLNCFAERYCEPSFNEK